MVSDPIEINYRDFDCWGMINHWHYERLKKIRTIVDFFRAEENLIKMLEDDYGK